MIKIKCEICGKLFQQITSTHLKKHNITLIEYKKLYPNSLIISSEVSQKLIKANKEKWANPEYKEKVSNIISKIITNQWNNGKYSRIQSEDHKRKRAKSQSETKQANPEKYKGINSGHYKPEINQFVKDNQGKHFCRCGCGEIIIIEKQHYNSGIPKFKYNHQNKMENNPNWKGGLSFEIYPIEFNNQLKTKIRSNYNNCDYISGIHQSICNNDRSLDVHHVDYDKENNNENNFISLSHKNHMRTNANRSFWNRLFTYSLQYDKEYYNDLINIWEINK